MEKGIGPPWHVSSSACRGAGWGDILPAGHTHSLTSVRGQAILSSFPQFPVNLASLRTFAHIMMRRLRAAWLSELLSPGDSSLGASHGSCPLGLIGGRYLPLSSSQPWCWILAGTPVSSLWVSPPEHPPWLPLTCPRVILTVELGDQP